ncbi:MAG: SGNH/GDSL hydrolase family protein [Deltaproteobacteria bacterium]|jgi:lysophospholipase L1-like esterase|nr:SGNH/GDSL hydrolase family protein [Deltaproteobacteria bacterium]
MNCKWIIIKTMLIIIVLFLFIPNTYAGDTTEIPNYLASAGDSISVGVNAERFGDNTWASWVNGYHGFWQWLFGLTNVKSHNQRISWLYPYEDRRNYMFAEAGAKSEDLADQVAAILASHPLPTYVTVFIGQNDICRDIGEEITPIIEYLANVALGLNNLAKGLPPGSTILVVGPVDVTRLYEVARDKKALGIVDCEVLWFFSLFDLYPCWSVLGPGVDDVDRTMIYEDFIQPYNTGLETLVMNLDAADSNHNFIYSNRAFSFEFLDIHVSDRDCFHPSAIGQKKLSKRLWKAVLPEFLGVLP